MERIAARDSGAVVICRRDGVIDSVDSERIIVRVEGAGHEGQMSREVGADIYQLTKFRRSNQNTCINQKPIVQVKERVTKGQVLADGPCTATIASSEVASTVVDSEAAGAQRPIQSVTAAVLEALGTSMYLVSPSR